MKVVHWTMIYCNDKKSIYATQICDCRRGNGKRSGWSGRLIEETGQRVTFNRPNRGIANDQARRSQLDNLARSEAVRLGLPSGPDLFPFAP